MSQDRKLFGITIQQMGILIGLAVFACLLFGLTGFLILRRSVSGLLSHAPVMTPTIQPTATLIVIPTATITETPTPLPYEQLIPADWKQFKTTLIEIWLPPTFKSTKKDVNEELAAVNAVSKKSLYKTLVSVAYEPLDGNSLDAYIDTKLSKMDSAARVVERKKVSLNSTEAIRMVIEGRTNGLDVNELVYLIQDGSTVWSITYVAQINEFYDALPTFEQSAKTFRIVK
jgi:hypothetical protein